MKKKYISPMAVMHYITPVNLMEPSQPKIQSVGAKKGGTVLSREDRFWDDEDED